MVHLVEGLGKIQLSGRLTASGGISAFCGERENEVSVHDSKKKKEYRFRLEYG